MTKTVIGALAGLLIALLAAVFYLNREHSAKLSAMADADMYRLKAAGQIVSSPAAAKDLSVDVAKLAAENADLRTALAKTLLASPGAKVTATVQLATAPVPVIAAPRLPETPESEAIPLPPCPGGIYNPDGMGGFYCVPSGASSQKAPDKCLLASSDTVSFHATEVELRTTAGSRLLTGTDELWRETPAPRAKLAQGTFSASLSDVATLEAPKAPGWGALAFGLCTSAGCGAGVGVAFPPQRFLGLTAEPFLAAFSGGAGTGALGGLTVR